MQKAQARASSANSRRRRIFAEPAIEKALNSAPNAKAVTRAAARLRRVPGILSVGTGRCGSERILAFRDRYFTRIDRRRLASGGMLREYETMALAYRKSNVAFHWGRAPRRATESMVYLEAHAIARFIERGPLDPRKIGDGTCLLGMLDAAYPALSASMQQVESAVAWGRLEIALASAVPVPCPVSGGIWVLESTTSGEEDRCEATAVTYVGPEMLAPGQHAFVTACADGDFIAALNAYPEALRRYPLPSAA